MERFRLGAATRSAGLRPRPEGAVGDRREQAPARAGHPLGGLAARRRHLRRLLPLPHGGPPGLGGLRRRPLLRQSLPRTLTRNSSATRRIPPSADSSRAASASPTARAPSPQAASCRCPSSSSRGRAASATTRVSSTLRASRAATRRSSPACSPPRPRSRRCSRGARATSSPPIPRRSANRGCSTSSTGRATSSSGCRRACTPGRAMVGVEQFLLGGKFPWTLHHRHADHECLRPAAGVPADRLPEARRQAHLRPAVLGVHLEHQPRGEPAEPPHAQGRVGRRSRSTSRSTRARSSRYCPGGRLRVRDAGRTARDGCRSTRRTACTARPATSRTRRRTSSGWPRKAAADRTTRTCESHHVVYDKID